MRKHRRGSKIVEFVKRGFKHLDKTNRNNGMKEKEFHRPSQQSTTLDQNKTTKYSEVQKKPLINRLKPADLMTLLNDDLYLSDSNCSDDDITNTEDINKLSSDFFSGNAIIVPSNKSANDDKNNITNNSEKNLKPDDIYNFNETSDITEEQYKSKRRQATPSEWKKNLRKNKRQHGEPYVTAKGILVPGKTLRESKCKGHCIHHCTSKFNEEERLNIFSSFWDISTVAQKRLYIVNLIQREKTKAIKRNQSRKKITNRYFLRKSGESEKIRVCQKFFVATLNVSETFIRICLKKVLDNNIVVGDKRGKHSPHNKKPKEVREHVRNHIKSFQRLPPPRVKKDSKREYLSRNLNLTKMYNLYLIKCDCEQRESVELAYYRSVFNNDFNIGFHRPGRDICDICLGYERMNKIEKKMHKAEREIHIERIDNARQHRNEAISLAKLGEIHFAEYDLKTIRDYPSSSKQVPIPVNNFILLDFFKQNRNVLCYCWPESIARRGAVEIGSCLYKFLQNNSDGRPITFMSDTSTSQCRNMYISSLLLYCIEIFDIPEINHKYIEQGHSQLETDNLHADIEKTRKSMTILKSSDFYKVINKTLQKYPNNIYEMTTNDFIDLKYLKNLIIKNTKVDHDGEPVNWLNIRWIQYRKENTNYIYFKYDLDDIEFKKIEVIRKGKRLQNCEQIVLLKNAFAESYPFH